MNDLLPLLSEADTARLLGRTKGTLRNWRSQGLGPRWVRNPDTGQFIGYRSEDVREWLDRGSESVS